MAKLDIYLLCYRLVSLWEEVCFMADRLRTRLHGSPAEGDEQSWLECDDCGETLRELDRAGHSATYTCLRCRECYLCIDQPEFASLIWLRRFHRRRGEGPTQRPLTDLRMATQLVECLHFDCWPSSATVVDYGIDSSRHLGALQFAVQSGVTAYELDRVMGDGAAITRLVRDVPGQPDHQVEFRTAYDLLPEEDDEGL